MTRWQFWVAQGILLLGFGLAFVDVLTPAGGNASASIAAIIVSFIISAIFYAWGHTASKFDELQDIHSQSMEKRKRERIDNVLRDMSSEDLQRLKQRLSDGIITDEILEEELATDEALIIENR